ncbi:MAG: Gfo/Idh/MocA family oxidoreductase, partial [bacterium]
MKTISRTITRRQFCGSALACAAAAGVISQKTFGQEKAPAQPRRMNVACIGIGGQMGSDLRAVAIECKQNIVALCDVDEGRMAAMKRDVREVANAREYKDYRKLLESEKNLDAVVIATPDHWHAPICKAAILAGKHVFCEKPLTHAVSEARELRELVRKSKVVTQTGNQGAASGSFRRSMELIQAGILGNVSEVHIWHPAHGWPSGDDRPAGEDPVPQGLDWDFWLGPAPARPYKNGIYHPAQWRGWYDFGNG